MPKEGPSPNKNASHQGLPYPHFEAPHSPATYAPAGPSAPHHLAPPQPSGELSAADPFTSPPSSSRHFAPPHQDYRVPQPSGQLSAVDRSSSLPSAPHHLAPPQPSGELIAVNPFSSPPSSRRHLAPPHQIYGVPQPSGQLSAPALLSSPHLAPSHQDYRVPQPSSESTPTALLSRNAAPVGRPTSLKPLPPFENFVGYFRNQVFEIIRSNDLDATGEQIFRYVVGWVGKEYALRRNLLLEMLLEVRLIFLPFHFLASEVAGHDMVRWSSECQHEVAAAMMYRLSFHDFRMFLRKKAFNEKSERPYAGARVFEPRYCERRRSIEPAKLIYAIGSREKTALDPYPSTTSSVEHYDPVTREWTDVREMPYPRERFAAAAYKGEIWTAGGSVGTEHVPAVYIYNPIENQWRAGPEMKRSRSNLGLIEYMGLLLAIGGESQTRGSSDETFTRYFENSIEILNGGTWKFGSPMNVGRAGMGIAVLRRGLYVLGGEIHNEMNNRMEVLDSTFGRWLMISSVGMPAMNHFRRLVVYDGMVYVFGRSADNEKSCYACSSQTFETGQWQSVDGIIKKCLKPSTAVAQVDGRVYFVGGNGMNHRINQVSMFNLEDGSWHEYMPSCNYVRTDTRLVVMNDHRPWYFEGQNMPN